VTAAGVAAVAGKDRLNIVAKINRRLIGPGGGNAKQHGRHNTSHPNTSPTRERGNHALPTNGPRQRGQSSGRPWVHRGFGHVL